MCGRARQVGPRRNVHTPGVAQQLQAEPSSRPPLGNPNHKANHKACAGTNYQLQPIALTAQAGLLEHGPQTGQRLHKVGGEGGGLVQEAWAGREGAEGCLVEA